jgi:hypothetical protein
MKRYILAFTGIGLLAFIVFNFTIPPYIIRDNLVPAVVCAVDAPLDGCISLVEAISAESTPQPVVYINGIQNNYADHMAALPNIQAAFHGAAITGIYNATVGMGHDLVSYLRRSSDNGRAQPGRGDYFGCAVRLAA